ncbi:hypothetical protein HPB49_025263 [Dermacentor silvarum]|uniref:Uncharacterized protein n=1 Tax=Dermacentor silvarum TaxID=543639 RepID=A0ACB8DHP1_DERSI|nr:hypothetical protein HPB49_025263 [Dermacentor silvarum]
MSTLTDVAKRRKDRKRKKHGGSSKKKTSKKGSSHDSSGSSSSSDESSTSSDSSSRSSSSDGSDDQRSRKRRASEEPSTATTDISSSKKAKHSRKKKESKRHRHSKKASGSSDSEDSSTGDKHHKKRKKHKSKDKKQHKGKAPSKEKMTKSATSSLVEELKDLLPKTGGPGSLFDEGKGQKPAGLLFSDPMKDLLPKPASSFLNDALEEAISKKDRSSSHHLADSFGEMSSKNGPSLFSESLSDFSKSRDTSALFEESLNDIPRLVAEPPMDMPASKPMFKDTFKELVPKASGGATSSVSIFSGDLEELLPKAHDSSDEELRKPPSPSRAVTKNELGKPQKVIDFDFDLEGLDDEHGFGGSTKSGPKATAGSSSQLIHFDIDFENLDASSTGPSTAKEKYSPSSPTSAVKKDGGSDPEPDKLGSLLRNPSPPPPRRNSTSKSSPDQ